MQDFVEQQGQLHHGLGNEQYVPMNKKWMHSSVDQVRNKVAKEFQLSNIENRMHSVSKLFNLFSMFCAIIWIFKTITWLFNH